MVPASFVAALVSVPAAALAFTGMYALGGTADIPLGTLAAAMVGVHVLIGIGEAVITALAVEQRARGPARPGVRRARPASPAPPAPRRWRRRRTA